MPHENHNCKSGWGIGSGAEHSPDMCETHALMGDTEKQKKISNIYLFIIYIYLFIIYIYLFLFIIYLIYLNCFLFILFIYISFIYFIYIYLLCIIYIIYNNIQ